MDHPTSVTRSIAARFRDAATPRGSLERLLAPVAELRPGELIPAVLMTLNIFLLLGAYYLVKVVREPLILLDGAFGLQGAELKAAAAAAQALLLLAVIPAYGLLASRVGRMKLINTVAAIFLACLVGFNLLAHFHVPVGLAFFIWVGVFNLMIVAQFWSFANDLYTEEQGKRIFAIVGFGGAAGAIVGSYVGGDLARAVGPYQVMLVSAAVLLAATLITNLVHRVVTRGASIRRAAPAHPAAVAEECGEASGELVEESDEGSPGAEDNQVELPPMTSSGGFRLVARRRYLLLIALMTLTYNVVNSNGEFILGDTVRARALDTARAEVVDPPGEDPASAVQERAERIIGGFYGDFFTYVNILTALFQLFLVSRIFKHLGVGAGLFFLPLIALGSYSMIAVVPLLSVIKVGKVLENSTDYSVQNTTRQALFLPTSRDAKYKAKAAIDTFFVRFGDVGSFVVVFLTISLLGLAPVAVAFLNIGLIGLWLWLCIAIRRHNRRLSSATQVEA